MFRHLRQLILFTIYFVLMFLCFLYRPTPLERVHHNSTLLCMANFDAYKYERMKTEERIYIILNIVVVTGAMLYLLQMYIHIRNVGKTMYFRKQSIQ